MEIKPQALPVFAPGLGGVSGNAGREEAVPEAPAGASGTSGAHTATQALCDAACDLLQAQARRNQAHAQAAGLAARALGRGGIDHARLDSLQESLAGVALSEKLDKPREDAAGVRLLGLLRQAGAGQTDGSSTPLALTPYAAGAMPTASAASGQTLNDIWEELAGKISTAEGSDLKPHASAVEQYTKLYQGLSNILSDVGKWVRPDGDNHMRVDFEKLKVDLSKLLKSFTGGGRKIGASFLPEITSLPVS